MPQSLQQDQKQESPVSRIRQIIALFEDRLVDRQRVLRVQVKDLLTRFPEVSRKSRMSTGSRFNLVAMCGLGSDEVQHSSILAWLLDETGSHGQGGLFFNTLAPRIGLKLDAPAEGYSVHPEFAGFESITDIVIYKASDFYISIENKINAGEGDDQLNREYRDRETYAKSMNIPPERRVAVFLTPDGRQPVTGNPKKWIRLSYAQIASVFNSLPYAESALKLKYFVEDWTASIKNQTQ